MTDPSGSPAAIVFRRLDRESDRKRAAALLGDCVLDDHDSACVWYGLCDLSATEPRELAGVVRVRILQPTTARLCDLAVSATHRNRALTPRLVSEVADRLRASGVEELTAPPATEGEVAALLARVGFGACERSRTRASGWLRLPL